MPFVKNPTDGIQIYYESIRSGPPLVIHQGFMRTTVDCHELGYVDALRNNCQLVLFDCRAHGRSDGPHYPEAYAGELLAGDVAAVLDALGIQQAHFVGYSTGGRTGYAPLQEYPERLLTLAVGGKDVLSLAPDYLDSTIESLSAEIEEFIDVRERLSGRTYPARLRSRLLELDAEALRNKCLMYIRERVLGLAESFKHASVPILLYTGNADPDFAKIEQTAGMIP